MRRRRFFQASAACLLPARWRLPATPLPLTVRRLTLGPQFLPQCSEIDWSEIRPGDILQFEDDPRRLYVADSRAWREDDLVWRVSVRLVGRPAPPVEHAAVVPLRVE